MIGQLLDRLGVGISHPSNRFWAATSISFRGWVLTVRKRRKGERQTYRRWLNVEVFNYNYSEEAKRASREGNATLGREAFPGDGRKDCHNCGQPIPHGEEEQISSVGVPEGNDTQDTAVEQNGGDQA